jgi:predicted SprT family Zn-dependent metalloprotease
MNLFAAFRKSKTPAPTAPDRVGIRTSSHIPAPDLTQLAAQKLAALQIENSSKKLSVFWNPRMRSTAGLAYPTTWQIILNPKLLAFGNGEVERTLLHELAHLVAHHRSGRRKIAPHGPEWRQACQDLGLRNEARCHDLPLPRRKVARAFIYECPSCQTRLERVRAFRRAAACMTCCRKHCSGRYDERFKLVRIPKDQAKPAPVAAF